MAIITISRGSYSKGREVAEKVAERLNYQLLSREVLLDASEHFHIPEVKLIRSIHDAPSVLDRFSHGRLRFISYIQSALTSLVRNDNVVYHGLAGHLLIKNVPHVVKVRIVADIEDRVEAEMKREGMGYAEARALLLKDDEERRGWTQSLYGVDPWDASLYDLVIRIHKLTIEDAVDFISQTAGRECFRTTPEAQRKMDDAALSCRIKAILARDDYFDLAVTSEFGNVLVYTKRGHRRARQLEEKLEKLVGDIPGINHLELREGLPLPDGSC